MYSEVGCLSKILNTPEYKGFPNVGELTFWNLAKIDADYDINFSGKMRESNPYNFWIVDVKSIVVGEFLKCVPKEKINTIYPWIRVVKDVLLMVKLKK